MKRTESRQVNGIILMHFYFQNYAIHLSTRHNNMKMHGKNGRSLNYFPRAFSLELSYCVCSVEISVRAQGKKKTKKNTETVAFVQNILDIR